MIYALIIGRGGSKGFPGKNTKVVNGKPLMSYPIIAARKSKYIDDIYISTDSIEIQNLGEKYGATFIQRPPELCTDNALGEDAFKHGYEVIKERNKKLIFCIKRIQLNQLLTLQKNLKVNHFLRHVRVE